MNENLTVKFRGAVKPDDHIDKILDHDYSFIHDLKMGYFLSVTRSDFGFHVVDRFASFPLFYVIKDGRPIVSQNVDELIEHLDEIRFDPIGYYSIGTEYKGERTERTPFVGISRILPGHYLEYKQNKWSLHCYWAFVHLKGRQFKGSYAEACEELGYLLKKAVGRCYSFAPNAALHLSGGLDSGSIAALYCQMSKDPVQAYAIHESGAPILNDVFESGYIQKYQDHFPQLKIKRYVYNVSDNTTNNYYPAASNWYGIQKDNFQTKILGDAKQKQKKYILTGLGGDELASYGHSYQDVGYTLQNDWQAKLYVKWRIYRYSRFRSYIKALIGRDGNVIDAIASIRMLHIFNDFTRWYTNDFKKLAYNLFERPVISLYWYPSSYDYRLELLDRSWLSIRSDAWNLEGAMYNIDYLHPLLDSDLVEFCASLPTEFFRNKQQRMLIKLALKDMIPNSLLEGKKRPVFAPPSNICQAELKVKLSAQLGLLQSLSNTFANQVYDYDVMIECLEKFIKILGRLSSSKQKTLNSYKLISDNWYYFIRDGLYINKHFNQF